MYIDLSVTVEESLEKQSDFPPKTLSLNRKNEFGLAGNQENIFNTHRAWQENSKARLLNMTFILRCEI